MKKLHFLTITTLFLFLVSFVLSSCNNEETNKTSKQNFKQFSQLDAKQTGIKFSNNLIDDALDPDRNVMSFDNYFNGGGVAIGDINNDGLLDVFFVGSEVNNKLYLNKGDMEFEDISKSAKINRGKGWATGVTMADVNGDGWLDIYVCQSSNFNLPANGRKNLLYINDHDNTFTESASTYGLDDDNLSHHASFFDYDNDGDLDCYVMNSSRYVRIPLGKVFKHLDSDKKYVEEASGKLFRNDDGKFVNVTEAAGMLRYGFGHNTVVSDINEDGWLDIYITNDYSVPDFMFINQKDGTFRDEIKTRTKQITFYGMGVDIADINNDGSQEIAVLDMAAIDHVRDKTLMASMNVDKFWIYVDQLGYQYQYMFNTLQLNNGKGNYSNIAHMSGVGRTEWSWAVLMADFDNDGFNDYYVTNGFRRYARDNDSRKKMAKIRVANNGSVPVEMRKKLYDDLPQVKLTNYIYQNDGDLHFVDKTKEWGLDIPSYSNGAAYGDLDNDGDLDIIVNNIDDMALVLQNNSDKNYLRFELEGATHKSPIIGTKITIRYGDQMQVREYSNARGYRGAVEANLLHFGLGDMTNIDEAEIVWPSGKKQILKNIKTNRLIKINEKNASLTKDFDSKIANTYFKEVSENDIIDFTHEESDYDDFKIEVLLPHKQSTLGPFISKGDVNNDQLEDIYIGGAAGQAGQLFIQSSDGKFVASSNALWNLDKKSEDQSSLFFDYDKDGDLDLYVVSGSNEFKAGSPLLQDRLYQNDGKGNFKKMNNLLPKVYSNGSSVKAADFDNDGDLDLFVGARSIPLRYPYADKAQLLENKGGKFIDITEKNAGGIKQVGMINDFVWIDFNGDKTMDLIMLGEWTAVSFYANKDGKFTDVTSSISDPNLSKGWWYNIKTADVDNDGDLDLICGNNGTNSKFHTSLEKPFTVFANDFDKNGTCDIVLSEDYKGELVPIRGRSCSSEQMPFISDKFKDYKSFASASVLDVFGDDLKEALHLQVTTFKSSVLINDNGYFKIKALPSSVQVAPMNGIVTTDINKDGNIDLVVAGNKHNTEIETPRYDGGIGYVLLGDGKGNFNTLSNAETGFNLDKNVKDIMTIKTANNKEYLLVANNNFKMDIYEVK